MSLVDDERKEECRPPLQEKDVRADPIEQFRSWFAEAELVPGLMAHAMMLATATKEGKPSARMVLLRGVGPDGFVFYTNYESRKGHELTENPRAALVFWWQPLQRQVRVEGTVELLTPEESDRYFSARPRGNQLEAHASPQSQVIANRAELEERFSAAEEKFAGRDVPRPPRWGGYRVVPEVIEFWQEGRHRLHDRLLYRSDGAGGWSLERLAP